MFLAKSVLFNLNLFNIFSSPISIINLFIISYIRIAIEEESKPPLNDSAYPLEFDFER